MSGRENETGVEGGGVDQLGTPTVYKQVPRGILHQLLEVNDGIAFLCIEKSSTTTTTTTHRGNPGVFLIAVSRYGRYSSIESPLCYYCGLYFFF